jgi:biopolymer transport protein ExbD
MRRRRNHRNQAENEAAVIDLTPVLDMTFIMLIFFIVTSTFVNEAGIKVQRPAAQTAQVQGDEGQVMIAIKADGEVWMDKHPVDIRAIRANIIRLQNQQNLASAVIAADRATQAQVLVAVMDQVRLAGIDNIAIATQAESR